MKNPGGDRKMRSFIISIAAVIVIFCGIILFGSFRLYWGSTIPTTLKLKASFSFKDTFVNMDDIGGINILEHPAVMKQLMEKEMKIEAVKRDIQTIEMALKLYRIDCGNYPTTEQGLEALIKKPETVPIPSNWRDGGYVTKYPIDPWGHPFYYASPIKDGKGYKICPGGPGRDMADLCDVLKD
jgi:general secretion pathway protein G